MEHNKTTPIKNLTNTNYKQVISDILENYKTNPEDLIELTKFSKNFTKYSINNDILLYKQNKGARFVATYNQWQNLGYKVIEKGSGMKLLQPNTITFFYNENNELKPIKEATKIEQEKIKSKEYKTVRKIVSFSTFIVHDISATNCPVEEYPNFYNMGYSSELHKNIADALIDYCADNRIMVSEEKFNSIAIRGLAYNKENVIKLNSLMEDTEKLSTLIHEIGHIKLHNNTKPSKNSPLEEFEADLLSVMFYTNYGIEITDIRKKHLVDSYKGIDKENFNLMKTLNEVHKEYKKLSKDFDKYIDKQLTINNISLDNGLEKNRLSTIKEILDSGNYIQKSIIEAKAGEFCIGENKNPLQIIEKNGNEYKAIDLVNKKEVSSSVESKFENKDNNIASIPIFKNDKSKDIHNDITVKINFSEHPLFSDNKYRTLSFPLANKLLTELDKKTFEVDVGYLKTEFAIVFKDKFSLEGRFDIGCEKTDFISFLKNFKDDSLEDILDYYEKNTELSLEDNNKFNEIIKEADKLHNEMLEEFGKREEYIQTITQDKELTFAQTNNNTVQKNSDFSTTEIENVKLEEIDLKKLIGQAIYYEDNSYTIENIYDNTIELNRPHDNPILSSIIVGGINISININDCENELKKAYLKVLSAEKEWNNISKENNINFDIISNTQVLETDKNIVAVKVGYELALIDENILKEKGILTTEHKDQIIVENQKYTLLSGKDFENSRKIDNLLDSGDYPIYRFNQHLKVVEKKDISKPQGYKKYNLDEITQIPIKTILDDLGYEQSRNGMYNIRGENTASVKIYENTNTYYDFGSTNGGNVISLIKETQNMDTKEAINFLGERYSIPYEQIGVDNTEKRLFLSNKEWQNLGLDGNHSSKNYIPNETLSNEEHTKLISRLSKINMNDLIIKEPMIFKNIIENNVIPSYIDNKNYYLSQLYNGANCEKVYGIKNQKEKEVVQGLAQSMAKEIYITLQNNYNSLKKIKEFIPDLKIDKLKVDFQKDLKNINNKSIEIGSFKHREMKELDGIKNYLTIPYKNYAEFEKEAKDFSYSAFLKGDKVTLTVLNTDKQQAQDLISQVKQLDFEKQNQKKTNISLEK